MPGSTFLGLNIGVSALDAMNQAQNIVSNNISNAGTAGYVQQSPNFVEGPVMSEVDIHAQMTEGVQITSVIRQTSDFIDQQDRQNQGTYQMYSTHSSGLTQIQSILNEPSSNSLQNALDQFFSSWQTLSSDPSNTAARQSVISEAQALGQTFGTVTNQLEQLQAGLQSTANDQLTQLNLYAGQVDQLNQQIVNMNAIGQSPNELLDQRDLILNNMANMANISYTNDSNGAVNVTLGDLTLVSSSGGSPDQVSDFSQITSGSMAGNQATIADTSNLLSQVNSFLTSFAGTQDANGNYPSSSVNGIQTKGYGTTSTGSGSSTTAPPMFDVTTDADGNVVLSLHATGFVDDNGNPLYITANDVAAASSPNQSGDNSNALNMVALQSDTTVYNNGTLNQGLAQMVSGIGVEASSVTSSETTADALAQQSSSMRQSIEGVDANQQETLMVQYQNSYGAAAKFISVIDQMLQTLINMVPN